MLGYRFSDRDLFQEALTHASTTGSRRARGRGRSGRVAGSSALNNERLEFLGDRVLALIVATMLIEHYPGEPEGALSKRLAVLVSGETLAGLADELGLARWLKVAAGERQAAEPPSRNMLADACEALIGAVYLDGGLAAAEDMVRRHWTGRVRAMAAPPRDPKMTLQEWVQARGLPLPRYEVLGTDGPAHAPLFKVSVEITGHAAVEAEGASKRAAEQSAARSLLTRLTDTQND
ncbi:ribonuclease III [Geminicoccaceae bacterium 1502E]|nr:ribonuclease III [Geminicoccaceae bacterium 1502E]